MVASDLQTARSRSIAAISVLDRRHFILIARTRHYFRNSRVYVLRVLHIISPRATQGWAFRRAPMRQLWLSRANLWRPTSRPTHLVDVLEASAVPNLGSHADRSASLRNTCSLNAGIKNEVGCRDDTVPKTVGTRRHCEEE